MSETHDLISGLNPVDQWVRQPPPTLPQPSVQPPPIQNGQAPARPAGQAADPLAPVMAKISSGESGGDDPYHETYGGGHFGWQGVPNTGSGKYGFVKSTWETASQGWMAANPGQPPPNFNEPQDQDRVARFWAQKTYKDKTGGRDLAADAQTGKVDYSALSGQWPSLDPNHSMHKGWADQDRAQHQQQGDGFREMWREYMKLATAETPGSAKRAELLYKAQESAERATEAFEQYQKTPPYYKPLDIMENFGSAATLLAIIGGAFAKRPLTASLQAAGLSMAAHQQQNWDQFKVANEQWKTQAEMGLQTVRLMHDQIREVMDDERLAENERHAKLRNLLSGMQMSQQQQQQWQTHTDRMLIASETAAQRLDNQKQRWEEYLGRIEERRWEKSQAGGIPGDILRQKDKERAEQGLPPMTADERADEMAKITAGAKPPSVAQQHEDEQISEVNAVLDRGDDVIAEIQGAMRVGLGGRIMRPAETLGNLMGVTDDTTRNRIESDISTLRQLMTRLLNNRAIMTARDQDAAAVIIRGLEPGSTIANTQDSIERAQDMLRHKYQSGLVRLKLMEPPKPRVALPPDLPDPSGHPEGYYVYDKNNNPVAKIQSGKWAPL